MCAQIILGTHEYFGQFYSREKAAHTNSPCGIVCATVTLTIPDQWDWVIVNLQHKGYFRVNYDTDNWKALIKQLNTDHKVRQPATGSSMYLTRSFLLYISYLPHNKPKIHFNSISMPARDAFNCMNFFLGHPRDEQGNNHRRRFQPREVSVSADVCKSVNILNA